MYVPGYNQCLAIGMKCLARIYLLPFLRSQAMVKECTLSTGIETGILFKEDCPETEW